MRITGEHTGDTPVARLNRDGLLEPIAVDPSLTDLLFAGPDQRSTQVAASMAAPVAVASEQSALFELV